MEETELVMFVMLARDGKRTTGLARGMAREGSFSPSGVACVEEEEGFGIVLLVMRICANEEQGLCSAWRKAKLCLLEWW